MTEPTTDSQSDDGPSHNARGFFVIGPQSTNASDVLAKMIAEAKGSIPDTAHRAPNPVEQRRTIRIYSGRLAQRIREQAA